MAKMRVYELANSLGIEVDRTMRLLREVGATPRNHMSVVERVPARRVRQLLKQNKNAALPPTQLPQPDPLPVAQTPVGPAVTKEQAPVHRPQTGPVPPSSPQVPDQKAPVGPQASEPEASPATEAPTKSSEATSTVSAKPVATKEPASPPVAPTPAAPSKQERKEPKQQAPVQRDLPATPPAGPSSAAPKGDVAKPEAQAKPEAPRSTARAAKPSTVERTERPAPARASERPAAAQGQQGATAGQRGRQAAKQASQVAPARQSASAEKPAPARSARPAATRSQQAASSDPRGPARGRGGRGGDTRDSGARATAPTAGPGQRRQRRRPAQKSSAADGRGAAAKRPTGPVRIPDSLTVSELADVLGVGATSIIMKLMEAGVMAAINQSIEYDVAASVAEKLGFDVTRPEKQKMTHGSFDDPDESLETRPPVVTIMGHVDHGKTTLLDVIRRAKVAEQEAGGITQHIGAYQVELDGQAITFLDTPGHEAFTAMRSRGAQVTDIAVLVVAADDGVMPQTIEAINHAKAADVPIIVAVNKMDRAGANPDRIKQQLVDHGLVPEEWGGDTICVEVSALQREGIDDLLEMILLVAEMRELKANPDRDAAGVVIDAQLDKTRGPVATVLVQAGTLRVGDILVAGSVYGRVRAMHDEYGGVVDEAGPSRPVSVLGLSDVPKAGDLVEVVDDERTARQIAGERSEQERDESQRGAGRIRLSEIYSKTQSGDVKDLNLLIKADVQGSVEALRQSVEKIKSDEVRINVIHAAVGGINESDVALAAASDAIIIGFNVRPETTARRAAEREDVEIRLYRVIYEAIEEIEAAMEGMLEPTYEEVVLGRAEVRATFRVPNVGTVAGCFVTEGKILRQAEGRLLRDHVVIHEGKLGSLKRFKDDVREVNEGYECGISFERYQDVKEGDIIEVFRMEEVKKG